MKNSIRLLIILKRLLFGEKLQKTMLAKEFNVSERSIQRDMSTIKESFAESDTNLELVLFRKSNKYVYKIINSSKSNALYSLKASQVLVLAKALLASRSLNKKELDLTLNSLLNTLHGFDKTGVEKIIKNEQTFYAPLQHKDELLEKIHDFSELIQNKQTILIKYIDQNKKSSEQTILPQGIILSEYYFYILFYNDQHQIRTYRLDRIQDYALSRRNLVEERKQDYSFHKLEDNLIRKKFQLMSQGEPVTLTLECTKKLLEPLLDRFPIHKKKVQLLKNGHYLVKDIETYTMGAKMWLLSQGASVKVIKPESMVCIIHNSLKKALELYDKN